MPRTPRFPNYPRKKHSSGQARIVVGGKTIYLGPFGSPESHRRYGEEHARWLANGCRPAPPPAAGCTVAEVVARFLDHASHSYDPRGRELCAFRLSVTPLLNLYGPTPAARFGVDELKAVRQAMVATLCRTTTNRRIVRLRTLWRWAEEEGKLVPPGSWAALRVLRPLRNNAPGVRQPAPRRPTTRAELDAVMPHCAPPVAAMLELQWLVGMRSCEVRMVRVGDIDRDGPCWLYRVRPDADKNAWRGGAPRVVPLGPECQRVLAPWLLKAQPHGPDAYLFPPVTSRGHGAGPHTRCYTTCTYSRAVARAACAAGLAPGFSAYGGRHAAASRIAREAGAEAARCVLGQKSIDVTAHYLHADLEHASQVAAKLA